MALKHRKTFNEINITPLTDIFLVLLIIMMVVAPMLDQQGLSLAVPSATEAQEVAKESKILTLDVNDDGQYFLDENIIVKEQKEKGISYDVLTGKEFVETFHHENYHYMERYIFKNR